MQKDFNPKSTSDVFKEITNVFSGGDGGIAFIKVKILVEEMARRAQAGDTSAKQVIDVVLRFAKLIEVAQTAR